MYFMRCMGIRVYTGLLSGEDLFSELGLGCKHIESVGTGEVYIGLVGAGLVHVGGRVNATSMGSIDQVKPVSCMRCAPRLKSHCLKGDGAGHLLLYGWYTLAHSTSYLEWWWDRPPLLHMRTVPEKVKGVLG